MRGGRPIRFLFVVIGGWTTLRALALWPQADAIAVVEKLAGAKPAAAAAPWRAAVSTTSVIRGAPLVRRSAADAMDEDTRSTTPLRPTSTAPALRQSLSASPPPIRQASGDVPMLAAPLVPVPIAPGGSRLAGSAWLIARGGGSDTLIGSQLGASQAGARLTYALGDARRVALSARIAAPLRGRGAEAGLGIDWQPTRAPIHLIVEQRIAIDGGRGGPAALAVGGVGPVEPVRGLRIEAYGQAGAIHRGRVEAFADGAARATHPLPSIGAIRFDIGGGAWGGAQRGATRFDVGPTIGASVPVGGRALRLTADWRQRVAGNARPGSGPALSIGTDF